MPDMLVLSRNRTTGSLDMWVEIDTDPVARPSWESRPLPQPVMTREPAGAWPDESDVEWLQDTLVEYVDQFDWAPDEVAHIDWNGIRRDAASLACGE